MTGCKRLALGSQHAAGPRVLRFVFLSGENPGRTIEGVTMNFDQGEFIPMHDADHAVGLRSGNYKVKRTSGGLKGDCQHMIKIGRDYRTAGQYGKQTDGTLTSLLLADLG